MATEIASLVVTAEAQTSDAERGLDRLNQKHEKTVANLKSGQGQVASYGAANRQASAAVNAFAASNTQAASAVNGLAGAHRHGTAGANSFGAAHNQATTAVRAHRTAVDGLRNQLQGFASDIQRVGRTLTLSITLPLLAASGVIIATGTKTSTSLNTLQAVTRATDAQMQQTRATARALGADLSLPGTSAGDSAAAMTELAKGGLSLEQSMQAARGTIQLARAATVSEAQAATIAADALNTFGLAGDQAQRVADLLAGSANASSGEITDMAAALAQAGAVAKGAGLSIEDTATAISLLAKNGIKGSDAGTSLKTFLLALQSPVSNDAKEMMDALGLSVYDLQGRMKPLPQIIGEFKARIDQLNPQAQATALREIFGSDAIRAARILFGEGTAGFAAMNKAITQEGSAAEIAAAKAKGLAGAWEGLKSTLETFADDVFHDLEEPLTKIVKVGADGVQFLAEAWNALGPPVKVAIGAFLGLLAAAGPVLVVLGSVAAAAIGAAGSIASIATAIGAAGGLAALAPILLPVAAVITGLIVLITEWVTIAVAAAVAISKAWTTNFLGIRDLTQRAWNAIKTFVLQVWNELRAAYQLIMPELVAITRTVLGVIQTFWTAHGEKIVAVVRLAWSVITTVIRTAIRVISSFVAGVLAIINGDWQKAWDMAVRIFDAFVSAIITLGVKVEQAIANLAQFIFAKAVQFYLAGMQLGEKLIRGFVDAMAYGAPKVVAAVIGLAIMLTSPGVLAAYARAGIAQARARNEAFEANLNNSSAEPQGQARIRLNADGTVKGEPTGGGKTKDKEKEGLPDLPDGPGGGGSKGENAAVRKFKLEMQIAEVAVQTVERLNQKLLADSEYFYSQGIQQLDQYVAAKRKAASALFRAENERNNQEAYALEASGIRGRQRDLAEAQLSEKVKATWQKHAVAVTEIERFEASERLAIQRASQEAQLALAQESAAGTEALWQHLAEQGVVTFAQAQKKIAESQLRILQMQKAILLTELGRFTPGTAGFEQKEHELQQHMQRMANFYQQMGIDATNANRRTVDELTRHKDQLRGIQEAIEDMEDETARDRLRILEQSGLKKSVVWQREMELEIQIEERRRQRRIAELERERAYTEQFEAESEKRRQKIEAIDRLIEAEEQRSAQRRDNIQAEYFEKQRQRLRDAADKIVGALKGAIDRYREEGWKGFFKSLGDSFRAELERMAQDLLKSRVLSLLQTVFKIPQVGGGATQSKQPGDPGIGGGGGFGGFFNDLFAKVFGGSGSGQSSANQASPSTAINNAGKSMTQAIEKGGQKAAAGVEKQGTSILGGLTSIGQGIVSTMLQVGTMLAAANSRGGFWKGLLMAAGMGAISGLTNGLFQGGGSGSQGGVGTAAGGAITEFAKGGFVPARAGGHLIRAGEGGFRELILTTDPSQRERMQSLLASYFDMTGLVPAYARGGFVGSGIVLPRTGISTNRVSSVVHKHYHLNVTHRGGSDPKTIKRSVAQVRRAYGEMVQQTGAELN